MLQGSRVSIRVSSQAPGAASGGCPDPVREYRTTLPGTRMPEAARPCEWCAPRRSASTNRRARAAAVLALLFAASRGSAQALPPSLATFLQQTIALKPDELRAMSGGTAIVKVLDTPDQREIAIFGIVQIGVPRSFY